MLVMTKSCSAVRKQKLVNEISKNIMVSLEVAKPYLTVVEGMCWNCKCRDDHRHRHTAEGK